MDTKFSPTIMCSSGSFSDAFPDKNLLSSQPYSYINYFYKSVDAKEGIYCLHYTIQRFNETMKAFYCERQSKRNSVTPFSCDFNQWKAVQLNQQLNLKHKGPESSNQIDQKNLKLLIPNPDLSIKKIRTECQRKEKYNGKRNGKRRGVYEEPTEAEDYGATVK